MESEGIIATILIGAIAGWLAGLIMKGRGMGFIVNALVGIAGAFVGSYLFGLIGFSVGKGLVGAIFTSTAGAVILLFIFGILRKSQ
ncbi:MAG: GlsB/YeaQ/YmgE family stress response membrane protein [gamma proteobacterium symbiont of Bathyaustriella thionipta]|nr:GlsB/YeaQ/YmgE family stress response membrane protein [gamma proteobacterium symbiont of Bathyaustriella thionipta]MCU7950168.1 GlsB/YeaQ/YmgE family stress response membrane protein [gamma proteobacterium symbiont of Bathyaustriella thionipta]MCU7952980.1 GlsB/YeaQ/YmgE family stress response membrane protein [gamma proteobacterium symbiont of Bathyaustriella thionipta]MCU7956710.1 GlsB/YeaQ/YmgE family stress response membrane protein [gamma proteobacterium symbiont of Bathyaustriella thio